MTSSEHKSTASSSRGHYKSAVHFQRPEILAPAGNEEMMRAAVENGADAVYFGVEAFNARLRADNFKREDLPRILSWLHERGVKGYLTLNILVFNDELEEARELLIAASNAGIDAVLVQDLGVAAMARSVVPELPIHASTQMTLTSAESVAAAFELGLNLERVVTARELSLRELGRMLPEVNTEIEVFVHGALCVAYSGQCLTSEALGGRSANRGECAQACRLPYDLIVDGRKEDLGDLRYLLSPKDLAAYSDVRELMKLGIVSLKIEGRLKTPEYVAATVQAYRAAVEEAFHTPDSNEPVEITDLQLEKLEATFSRGFTPGYIHEIDHQTVVEGRFPSKRGILVGSVLEASNKGVLVQLNRALKPGDGVVFDTGNPDSEEGGRVYEVFPKGSSVLLTFGGGRINPRRIPKGSKLWKTNDPVIDAELRASYASDSPSFRRPIVAQVRAATGSPLELRLTDWEGYSVLVTDEVTLEAATKHAVTYEVLREQLGRLGDTPYFLERLDCEITGAPLAPLSRLNALRRSAVIQLNQMRAAIGRDRKVAKISISEIRGEISPALACISPLEPGLSLLCRTLAQVEAGLECGIKTIYTDFEDLRLQKEARGMIPKDTAGFVPATLRIVKPGEAPMARRLLQAAPDGALVRSLAAWQVLRSEAPELTLIGDFSLNVANDLTARLLMGNGFSLLTPSYDLNFEQLTTLLAHAPAPWFEVTLHQYLPMFHMEHCVFCRFLSSGTDSSNCGRPCETHTVSLQDRLGYQHALKADFACRNTVFNAVPQSGVEYFAGLRNAGVKRFRIDLLNETKEEAKRVVELYRRATAAEITPHSVWQELRSNSKLGVTRGSLDHYEGGIDQLYSIGSSGKRKPAHAKPDKRSDSELPRSGR